MSTEMKTGLVLSGGGAVGAYQAGVVKALAECGTQISMVSGASIGAFNGAII
ncbi:patatin-like phospholipase family protein, partial [Escherichia coli]